MSEQPSKDPLCACGALLWFHTERKSGKCYKCSNAYDEHYRPDLSNVSQTDDKTIEDCKAKFPMSQQNFAGHRTSKERLAEAVRLLLLVQRASNDELRAEEISELYEEIREFLRTADETPALLAMGDPIPEGGCGCRQNGVPLMRANCRLHGAAVKSADAHDEPDYPDPDR